MKAMKNNFLYFNTGKGYQRIFFILTAISALFLFNTVTIAQETKDSASRLSFTMNLSSIVSNDIRSVKVQVSRKENKKTIAVNDVTAPFKLYLNEVKAYDSTDGSGLISNLRISYEGDGIFKLPAYFYKSTDSLHEFTFIVKMDSDPKYEDAEETISIADAKISIEYSGEDSVKTAKATLTAWKDSANAYVPIPNAEVKLCIKRTFNFLLFGESGAVTDETGQVSGDLPLDLPGNADGTLTIFGRLEDDENYGTVEGGVSVPWAVLPKKNPERGRTLWSSGDNAPLLLVISSVTIIVIIWGTIFYLISLLVKIKRLGKNH
jgi:hypothetical protein